MIVLETKQVCVFDILRIEETKKFEIEKKEPVQNERWYFASLADILAVCCIHPLDTLKVQLQTQQRAEYGLVCK
jgi:hypothetical protein